MSSCSVFKNVESKVSNILVPLGFECYPFKIGWYNEMVAPEFSLQYDYDTLAFVVISTPVMFDRAFKPFVCRKDCLEEGGRDLIDECIAEQFRNVCQSMPDLEIECVHDFELHHSRRPKVLVQTAGHVAGAAYYYQRKDVSKEPWSPTTKICGVSIHSRYGGWFALRGVIIFKTILVPDLERHSAPDVVIGDRQRIELLERFNFRWQDWSFRDIVSCEASYCELQKEYFSTPPQKRGCLLSKIRAASNSAGV